MVGCCVFQTSESVEEFTTSWKFPRMERYVIEPSSIFIGHLRQNARLVYYVRRLLTRSKALSLRFQGNFAKRCFICLVYIAISLIKIYLRRYVTMYSLISKLETKFRSMFMHRKIRHFFSSFD